MRSLSCRSDSLSDLQAKGYVTAKYSCSQPSSDYEASRKAQRRALAVESGVCDGAASRGTWNTKPFCVSCGPLPLQDLGKRVSWACSAAASQANAQLTGAGQAC